MAVAGITVPTATALAGEDINKPVDGQPVPRRDQGGHRAADMFSQPGLQRTIPPKPRRV